MSKYDSPEKKNNVKIEGKPILYLNEYF